KGHQQRLASGLRDRFDHGAFDSVESMQRQGNFRQLDTMAPYLDPFVLAAADIQQAGRIQAAQVAGTEKTRSSIVERGGKMLGRLFGVTPIARRFVAAADDNLADLAGWNRPVVLV